LDADYPEYGVLIPCRNTAIHTAFIKYPEGDGGPNLDYEWIAPDQSTHIAKAILQDLAANGYQVVKRSVGA
jgi:hypothetical protein